MNLNPCRTPACAIQLKAAKLRRRNPTPAVPCRTPSYLPTEPTECVCHSSSTTVLTKHKYGVYSGYHLDGRWKNAICLQGSSFTYGMGTVCFWRYFIARWFWSYFHGLTRTRPYDGLLRIWSWQSFPVCSHYETAAHDAVNCHQELG